MNKEFEEWQENHLITGSLENITSIDHHTLSRDIDILELGFNEGLKIERKKHRWRLYPQEIPEKGSFVIVKDLKGDRIMANYTGECFGIRNNGIDYVIEAVYWQPMPEA